MLNLAFHEGSGPVANDSTGNGNNCTLQTATGRTPAWTTAGLAFKRGQGCDLPASANNIQSWCFAFTVPPVPPSYLLDTENIGLLYSNLGNGFGGYSLLTAWAGSQNERVWPTINAPSIYSASEQPQTPNYWDIASASNTTLVGPNRLCYVLGRPGISLDRMYLNGAEVSYAVQGATAGQQTGSFLSIGGANVPQWVTAGGPQTIYHVMGFAGALSPVDITAIDQYFVADMQKRGVALQPVNTTLPTATLIIDGDSGSTGFGLADGANHWIYHLQLRNQPAYNQLLYAINGITALALGAAEPYRISEICHTNQGPTVVTVWDGGNDMGFFPYAGPVGAATNLLNQVAKLASAGCSVLVFTQISRAGNSGDGNVFETERVRFNQIVLNYGRQAGAMGIVDLASQPYLGATGAYANPVQACFFPDNGHPTDLCQPYIAKTVSQSMNYYAGSTLAAPSVYTSSNTLLSSDRVVDARGCNSACNFTLPDGTGPSGEVYTILTGAQPTTVQGATIYGYIQTVNGSSAPVALAANTTVKLLIVPLPQATAGIRWQMQ